MIETLFGRGSDKTFNFSAIKTRPLWLELNLECASSLKNLSSFFSHVKIYKYYRQTLIGLNYYHNQNTIWADAE
jgi:hypothetical protein